MSTQTRTNDETTTINKTVKNGWHAQILDRMSLEEFNAIRAGELEPTEFLKRHNLASGWDK